MMTLTAWAFWAWAVGLAAAANAKPSVGGKSVYFIVTDRFARSGENAKNEERCDLASTANPYVDNGAAWCNGTLQGVIDKLDYIQGMGFDCIWITPVVKSLDYTGYYAEDFFAIDPHLGTAETLKELSRDLHSRGMCLIIDIVANHVRSMTWADHFDASTKHFVGPMGINPFDKDEYFHTYGKMPGTSFQDYVMKGPAEAGASQGSNEGLEKLLKQGEFQCGPANENMTECTCFPGNFPPACPGVNEELQVQGWFGPLGDLNQDHPFVRQKLLEYVRYLVREYDVDAFRLDTAIYMPKDFLTDLQEAAGVEIFGEATVNNISYHASFQKGVLKGLLNFPAFYQIHGAFCQYHLGGSFGNYRLQGAFTPELPDLRKLAVVVSYMNSKNYPNLDLLGNFVDNHDEFARIGYYCDGDSYRIKNALAMLMFVRGTPMVYYGTEQGLQGHQANLLERAALEKAGKQNKGQAFVRESLWQTKYNTSTWQYKFIKKLNEKRKELGLAQPGAEAEMVVASYNHLVFKRFPPSGGEVWVFINNNQNWTGDSPFLYCPAPSEHEAWYDVFSGKRAYLRNGCFMADDAEPKVLVHHSRFVLVKGVERVSESNVLLWSILSVLAVCNIGLCAFIFRHRCFGNRFKILEEDLGYYSSDSDARC